MTKNEEIISELKALNSHLQVQSSNPFSAPDGYFNNLPELILARVRNSIEVQAELESLSPLLSNASRETPYTISSAFFADNLETLEFVYDEPKSTILELAGKELPYNLPSGYFSGVEDQVLSKIEKPQAKVISFGAGKWMRAAVAAAVLGVIGFAGFNYFESPSYNGATARLDTGKQQTTTLSAEKKMETELKEINLTDLDAFINNVDAQTNSTAMKTTSATADVKKVLEDIPDNELDLFLQQVPTGKDELPVID